MLCHHVTDLRSDGPPKVPREGDICARCAEHGPKVEDAPEEYRELLRAAQVLFDESMTDETLADEYVVIPTLAFAANLGKRPQLAFVRGKFAEVRGEYEKASKGREAWKSEKWMELDTQFFLNASATLQVLDMREGVLIIRSAPIDVTLHEDEGNAYLRLGEVLVQVGRKDEARAAYERGVVQAEKFSHSGMAEDLRGALTELQGA